MEDKRITADCPFCGFPRDRIQVTNYLGNLNFTRLFCPRCGCEFKGNSRQEVIDKWNARVCKCY